MQGRSVSLDSLRGRLVWLSFYRYAACPLCCYRIHELLSAWDSTFRGLGLVSLTVWQSPPDKLQEVIDRYRPPVQLISDPDLRLYEMYEIEKGHTRVFGKDVLEGVAGARKAGIPIVRAWDGPATRRPADFLISPGGRIDVAFYGENVGQMIPFENVVQWANAQRAAQ